MGKQQVAWKEYHAEYWLNELLESIDRCTGRSDITEILLKMDLNTLQSTINLLLPFIDEANIFNKNSLCLTLSQTAPGFYVSVAQVF